MPFQIVRDDIAHVKADAIVNAANEQLRRGGGVCGAIFEAAGARRLQRACDKIGYCPTGGAVVTPAYKLKARYIIHTVGPIWHDGFHGEQALLASCYRTSLELACEHGCRSVAFPLISAGIYGFPQREALQVAQSEIRAFLEQHDLTVTLVLYDTNVVQIADSLRLRVESYIDDVYVGEHAAARPRAQWEQTPMAAKPIESAPAPQASRFCPLCGAPIELPGATFCVKCGHRLDGEETQADYDRVEALAEIPDPVHRDAAGSAPAYDTTAWSPSEPPASFGQPASAPAPLPRASAAPHGLPTPHLPQVKLPGTLRNLLEHLDAGFSETLLSMIDARGLRDAQVYKRANLTRQHFSKIRSNPRYRPTKTTVLALAVALELSLDETTLLLERAGFALSHADQRDVIVEFFIREGNYDIFEINNTLFAFDQPLLG